MTTDDLQRIFTKWLGHSGIEILNQQNAWEQFGDFDETLLDLYEYSMDQFTAPALDLKLMSEKIKEYDEKIAALSKTLKIEDEGSKSFHSVFGELGVKHSAFLLYKLARMTAIAMLQKKALVRLLKETRDGQPLISTKSV